MAYTFDDILSRLQGATETGAGKYRCRCPNPTHPDAHPSCTVELTADGQRVLFCCHTRGDADGCLFLDSGISKPPELREWLGIAPIPGGHATNADEYQGVTPEQYGADKLLPTDFLRNVFGMRTDEWCKRPILVFPCYARDGQTLLNVRKRLAPRKGLRRWDGQEVPKVAGGKKAEYPNQVLYGLWLQLNQQAERVILCEGESDTQTLAYNGFPALGTPGVSNYFAADAETELERYKTVYVCIEDASGWDFYGEKLRAQNSKIEPKMRFFSLWAHGAKDPSDLWLQLKGDGGKFKSAMQAALDAARPFDDFFNDPENLQHVAAQNAEKQREAKKNGTDARAKTSKANGEKGGRPAGQPDYIGLARRFIDGREKAGQRVLFGRGVWYVYNGRNYDAQEDFASVAMTEIQEQFEAGNDFNIKPTTGALSNVVANVKPLCAFDIPDMETAGNWRIERRKDGRWAGKFDADTIAARNCLLHISADGVKAEPLTPDFFALGTLGTDYQPDAQCPVFMKFLNEIMPDADTRRALQVALGYSLGWRRDAQLIFFFLGDGANGKSTMIRIFQEVLGAGQYSTAAWYEMDGRFTKQDFVAKRVNISEETEVDREDIQRIVGEMKHISGGGVLRCDRKNQRAFDARAVSQLILVGNSTPIFPDESDAMRRRLRVIPFGVKIPPEKIDPLLAEKIMADELPGVLNWLLDGLTMVYRAIASGRNFKKLFESKEIEDENEYSWKNSNAFLQLVKDNFVPFRGCNVIHKAAVDYMEKVTDAEKMQRRTGGTLAKAMMRIFGVPKTRDTAGRREYLYRDMACVENRLGESQPINTKAVSDEELAAAQALPAETPDANNPEKRLDAIFRAASGDDGTNDKTNQGDN